MIPTAAGRTGPGASACSEPSGVGIPTTILRRRTPRGTTNPSQLPAALGGSRRAKGARRAAIAARRAALDRMRAGSTARDHTDHLLLGWCQQSAPDEEIVATAEP